MATRRTSPTVHKDATRGMLTAPFEYDSHAFGQRLVQAGDVSEMDWRLACEVARRNETSELRNLLDLGLVSEAALADRLAAATGAMRWDAESERGVPSDDVPQHFMQAHGVLVLDPAEADVDDSSSDPKPQRVVISDPSEQHTFNALLNRLASSSIEIAIATDKEIRAFLESSVVEDVADADESSIDISSELSALRDMASEAPVIRFFNQMVERAMDLDASDIHVERFDRRISLRYRVDGILVEQPAPALQMFEPLLCRTKIMAGLDIAERRRAQDGRVRLRLRGRIVDMRVSIVPTTYGQDLALRLQDRQKLAGIDLTDLGFSEAQIEHLFTVAARSHGILLITGPTGSGKTTTLYAILQRLVSTERKIMTVEDPVEYTMDGVNQIQVNPAIDLTFGNTLRHLLRHDPDTLLIGEIRDYETAEIAFQASLTGHMVLSTLHTNDVPSTFVRLVDMGIEPYLVNAAIEGVSAQRLLRRTCAACNNNPATRDDCRECMGIGYRGRVAVMEFSGVPASVKRIMLEGAEEHRIREALVEGGYSPMRDEARRLIGKGVTDEAEVARVLGSHVSLQVGESGGDA